MNGYGNEGTHHHSQSRFPTTSTNQGSNNRGQSGDRNGGHASRVVNRSNSDDFEGERTTSRSSEYDDEDVDDSDVPVIDIDLREF